eukprot:m.306924 g.306924  ORF g.306924 m.306924 type:complete len:1497 (+) comp15928_c0_seq1:215-4705(+)
MANTKQGSSTRSVPVPMLRVLALLVSVWFCTWIGFGVVGILLVAALHTFDVYRHHDFTHRQKVDAGKRAILQSRKKFSRLFQGKDAIFTPQWIQFSKTEKCLTLRTALEVMWPSIKVASEEIVKDAIANTFAQFKPGFLRELKLTTFQLSQTPPAIESIDTVPDSDDGVAIDIQLRIDGPSKIHIEATSAMVKVPVQLKNLKVCGRMRILLGPMSDELPCFKALAVSFLGNPTIDYSLNAVGLSIDLIPGLDDTIRNLIHDQVSGLLTWPKKIVVEMGGPQEPPATYSYLYSAAAPGMLHTKIVSAENLPSADLTGGSDPFAELTVHQLSGTYTTKIKHTLSPEWMEDTTFPVYSTDLNRLNVKIFDDDKTGKDLLGSKDVSIAEILSDHHVSRLTEHKYSLLRKNKTLKSTFTLHLAYKPFQTGTNACIPSELEIKQANGFAYGYFFVDIMGIKGGKAVQQLKFTAEYGEQQQESPIFWTDDNGNAVIQYGYAFPLKTTLPEQEITIHGPKSMGSATVMVDPEDIVTRPRGLFLEGVRFKDSDVVMTLHLTLRVAESCAVDDIVEPAVAPRRPSLSTTQKPSNVSIDDAGPLDGSATAAASKADEDREGSAGVGELASAKQPLLEKVQAFFLKLPFYIECAVVFPVLALLFKSTACFWSISLLGWLLLLIGTAVASSTLVYLDRRQMSHDKKVLKAISSTAGTAPPLSELERKRALANLPPWALSPDVEKVEWLNDLLHTMWPHVQRASTTIVETALNNALGSVSEEATTRTKTSTRKKAKTIPFFDQVYTDVQLSSQSPLVTGMKAYSKNAVDGQVVMDLYLNHTDDTVITIKLMKWGLAIPIELRNINLSTTARIVLTDFVPVMPCFAQMQVSLMEGLHLDFNLNVASIPIMSIPFLPQLINAAIERVFLSDQFSLNLSSELLYPRTMAIPIFDAKSLYVRKALRKKERFGILRVTVDRAHDLRNVDRFSKSDPYVVVVFHDVMQPVKRSTRVIDDDLSPLWQDEVFEFIVNSEEPQALEFTVKDHETVGTHEILGRGDMLTEGLADVPNTPVKRTFYFTHKGKPAGSLDVVVQYLPFTPQILSVQSSLSKLAVGAVFIEVLRTSDVPNMKKVFVKTTLGHTELKTDVKVSKEPYFAQRFAIKLFSLDDNIHFSVRNDGVRTTVLGQVALPISRLREEGPYFNLALDTAGTLEVNAELRTVDTYGDEQNMFLTWKEFSQKLEASKELKAKEEEAEKAAAAAAAAAAATTDVAAADLDQEDDEDDEDDEDLVDVDGDGIPDTVATDDTTGDEQAVVKRPSGFVHVEVHSGSNLPAVNTNGFSDPYISIECGNKKEKTKHISRTVNPEWNERFTFKVLNPATARLLFKIKDHERFHANRTLGQFTIPVSQVPEVEEMIEHPLDGDVRGSVKLSLLFVPDWQVQDVPDKQATAVVAQTDSSVDGEPAAATQLLTTEEPPIEERKKRLSFRDRLKRFSGSRGDVSTPVADKDQVSEV